VAGAPARLSVVTQPSATAVSGVPLAQQPVVQLLDPQGNPSRQSGVAVTASIGSGGGSLLGGTTATTDGEGRATFGGLVLVGTNGTRTLRFTADGFAAVTSSQISLTAASTVTTITGDSPDPSDAGAQVTVQFTVSSSAGTPTGSVRVRDGGDECTGALSGGQGSCTLALSNSGNRTLTAEYQGADGFAGSSDTEDHTVNAPPTPVLALTTQPSSTATLGVAFDQQPVVQLRTSDGADVATGGVSVSAAIVSGGGTLVGTTTRTTDASGRAEFTDLAITGDPGDRTLVFTASGFSSVNSGTISVQAPPPSGTSTTITSADPNPSTAGAAVTVQFTVTSSGGTPTGSVTVSDGTDSCSGDLSGGAGSCPLTLTTSGARTLTAQYTPGDAGFAASSGSLAHQVDPAVSGVRAAGGALQ
jgi:large repetitive protein